MIKNWSRLNLMLFFADAAGAAWPIFRGHSMAPPGAPCGRAGSTRNGGNYSKASRPCDRRRRSQTVPLADLDGAHTWPIIARQRELIDDGNAQSVGHQRAHGRAKARADRHLVG